MKLASPRASRLLPLSGVLILMGVTGACGNLGNLAGDGQTTPTTKTEDKASPSALALELAGGLEADLVSFGLSESDARLISEAAVAATQGKATGFSLVGEPAPALGDLLPSLTGGAVGALAQAKLRVSDEKLKAGIPGEVVSRLLAQAKERISGLPDAEINALLVDVPFAALVSLKGLALPPGLTEKAFDTLGSKILTGIKNVDVPTERIPELLKVVAERAMNRLVVDGAPDNLAAALIRGSAEAAMKDDKISPDLKDEALEKLMQGASRAALEADSDDAGRKKAVLDAIVRGCAGGVLKVEIPGNANRDALLARRAELIEKLAGVAAENVLAAADIRRELATARKDLIEGVHKSVEGAAVDAPQLDPALHLKVIAANQKAAEDALRKGLEMQKFDATERDAMLAEMQARADALRGEIERRAAEAAQTPAAGPMSPEVKGSPSNVGITTPIASPAPSGVPLSERLDGFLAKHEFVGCDLPQRQACEFHLIPMGLSPTEAGMRREAAARRCSENQGRFTGISGCGRAQLIGACVARPAGAPPEHIVRIAVHYASSTDASLGHFKERACVEENAHPNVPVRTEWHRP